MRRIGTVILILVVIVLLIGGFLFLQSSGLINGGGQGKPTAVAASVLTPAPTPTDGRQVAVLTLSVTSSGDVPVIQLTRGQILNSEAPSVFGRSGEWTVEIVGQETVSFGIGDPRILHVYPKTNTQNNGTLEPHTIEMVSGPVTFELVVPLYLGATDLGAQQINIYDQAGERIYATDVDRNGWKDPRNDATPIPSSPQG